MGREFEAFPAVGEAGSEVLLRLFALFLAAVFVLSSAIGIGVTVTKRNAHAAALAEQ